MATATQAPVKLSKGKVLAGLLRQLDEVRDDRKEAMAAYKKDEQRLGNEIRRLAGDIETGQSELFDVADETAEEIAADPEVTRAMDAIQKTCEKDGTTLSIKLEGGEEHIIADGRPDADELLEDAKKLVIDFGKGSASHLQRRLRIGYSRAAKLLDLLERDGIIGPADGPKPREVIKK